MKVINVLFISHIAHIGGAEISLTFLLKHINKENFYPMVVLPAPGPLSERLAMQGIETIILPLNRLRWRNPLPYIRTVYKLVKLIKARKINLVQTNIEFANQYGVVAAWLTGIPCVAHIRNILSRMNFWEYFLFLPNVLIANSFATAKSFQCYTWKWQRTVVIHNGVDLEVFNPATVNRSQLRENLSISSEIFLIGVVGRITPGKGQHVFLEALSKIPLHYPEIHALIVGDITADGCSQYEEYLHRQVIALGLKKQVTFTGFVKDMINLYAVLDALVLPSVAEPFGRTLIEAMAMEKPVIATHAGGPVEVVEEGETGLLVSPNNPTELAEKLSWLVKNRDTAKQMGRSGRKRVEKLFDISENVRKIECEYMDSRKRMS